MADQHQYAKKRKEFGRHPQFDDTVTKIVGSVMPNPNQKELYQLRDPNKLILDNIPQFSEHRVNTERIPTHNRGMKHVVGGWPQELDYTEPADIAKYQKKLYRDPALGFSQATKDLTGGAQKAIKQNNEIDLFEEYFHGEQPELSSESISTKTVMIFKDPNPIRRAVTKINWHPEATTDLRIGVSYAMLRFQQMPPKMPLQSYIWNLNNPNHPEKTLAPPSSLCTMVFNHKNSDIIVGGSYNGSLSFFDQRKGSSSGVIKPVETTLLEKSHHDPVYDIYWLTVGKSGTECVSTSTDGRILWWDMKKLGDGPVDELVLSETFQVGEQPVTKILGGTSLEYN
jgi:dynein intermediate chain 2, axonemal